MGKDNFKISARTKLIGLFGYPVEHSLSPAMHNAALRKQGIDACYLAFSVRPEKLKDAVNSLKALNFAGANVTVPYKEKVIPLIERVDKEAAFIGAVNTIVNKNNVLTGYNTDGKGFMKSLAESRISVKNKNILIIGTGGAARAISYYLSKQASRLFLYDIDIKKAGKLVKHLQRISKNVSVVSSISALDAYDIIINATPLGLKKSDPLPIPTALIKSRHIVCDLIYWKTRLLSEASRKGCKTMNGLGMLLWQGVFAFELWTGKKPPVEVMRKALTKNL